MARSSKILAQHIVSRSIFGTDLPMLGLDAVLFEQVLVNVLENAAKYAPPGTLVRIRGWRRGTASRVQLQIIDEGSGIPPEDLERVFDKFHRVQKADQVRAGTGLGLAISRGFIEAHGRLDHSCEPLGPSGRRVHHHAAHPQANRTVGHGRMTSKPLKVLVVDDEPPIRKLLRMGLGTQGYQIIDAANATAALDLLAEAGFGHPRPGPA